MREDEVPQDQGIAEGLKEVTYAVDAAGHYKLVPSAGWEPKNISNYQAWEVVAAQVAEARQAVLIGRVSPLAFHMARNQMDTALLAQYMGLPRWRVWLHLRPWGFRRLSAAQLEGYAAMLRTSVAQLQDISLVAEMQIPGRDSINDAD